MARRFDNKDFNIKSNDFEDNSNQLLISSNVNKQNKQINQRTRNIVILGLASVIFLVYLLLDSYVISPELFKYSVEYESQMQKNSRTKFLDRYFYFWAILGNQGYGVIIGLLYLLHLNDKFNLFVYLLNFELLFSISQFMKLSYHHPRPYWVSESVTGIQCETGFGHPSGHSLAAVYLWTTLYIDYIYQIEKVKNNLVLQIVIIFSFIFIVANILFSRIYLGVHGIDQVLLGSIYALYFIIFYYTFSKKHIGMLITYTCRHIKKSGVSQEELNKFRLILTIVFLVLIVVLSVVFVSVYKNIQSNFVFEDIWIERMLKVCNKTITKTSSLISGLIGSATLMVFFTFFFGVMLRAYIFENQDSSLLRLSFVKKLVLELFSLIIAGVIPIILVLTTKQADYLTRYILMLIAITIAPIFYFVLAPFIQYKMQLVDCIDLDDLQEEEQQKDHIEIQEEV